MLSYSVDQRGQQKIARWLGTGEKAGNQISGASAFPILAGQLWRIKKSPLRLMAVEKPLLKETVECGHYGGVRELAFQLLNYVAHTAFPESPHHFHYLDFKRTQHQVLAHTGG